MISRACTLHCDECLESVLTSIAVVYHAREFSKSLGWHFSKGRDICADCWTKGVR